MCHITLIKGDLFTAPERFAFCHCVSKDLEMGAGIAKSFADKFPKVKTHSIGTIDDGKVGIGDALYYQDDKTNRIIFSLITKKNYWDKPAGIFYLPALTTCLEDMKNTCEKLHIYNIAMPKLGCGLDRMQWGQVQPIIEKTFDSEFTIDVYYL